MERIPLDPNWITAIAALITALVAIYLLLADRREKKKANLSLSMRTIFHCPEYTISALIIRNDGPARAKDVKITINNTSLQEYGPATKTTQPYKKVIDPKSKIEYSLQFGALSPPQDDAWNYKGEALKALGDNSGAATAFAKAKELGYRGNPAPI